MIKLTPFLPFQNFLRSTQEYHEDKALIKIKSFNVDREYEFKYKDITEIVDSFRCEYNQYTFGFWLLGFNTFMSYIFKEYIYTHPFLLRIEQVLYIVGLLIFFTGFKKTWWFYFIDKNDNVLAYIKQNGRNRDLIPQIIELIKQRAVNIKELTAADPFPDEPFEYELIEHDLPEYEKITERFYRDEVVGIRQSPFNETVYRIQYKTLNGKVFRGKTNNDIANTFFSIATITASIYGGYILGFSIPYELPFSKPIAYILIGLFVIAILSLPLNLIKREVVGLYNKDGNIAYSTHVNRKNKDKVEKIIEYVVSRIPTKNKQQFNEDQ
jgi:uncharacterized membrane protein (Fun14 family)